MINLIDEIKILVYRLTKKRKKGQIWVSDLKGRERVIVDIEIDGIDFGDYPKFCDAFIMSAVWDDTGKELSDTELDEIMEANNGLAQELAYDQIF